MAENANHAYNLVDKTFSLILATELIASLSGDIRD